MSFHEWAAPKLFGMMVMPNIMRVFTIMVAAV